METHNYSTGVEILFNFADALTLPATVDSTGVQPNADNRKIIKAGTPLGADKPFTMNRNQTLIPSDNPSVILLHDTDVTDGSAPATVVVRGDIVFSNMEKDIQNLYNDDIINKLSKITFVKGA